MSKELDYITELERKNRLLGERCNQLLKDKGELIDKIEKMKCCCNCTERSRFAMSEPCLSCKDKSKWKLKE